jgi:PAS domain S-box-containing protein
MSLARLPRGEIVDVNEEWVKLFGFTKKEAVGKTSVELGINRDSKHRARIFREIKERGFLWHETAQFFNKRGEARIVDCNMKSVTLGGQKYVLSTMHDVTEQKRAENALRASEQRFRRYFDLSLIGMATTSPAKGILEVNDELCRILGYDRSDLLKKSWAELTHPDDVAADVAQFGRVLAGEIDGYTLEKRWICKHGRVIHSIMAAKCQRRADGSVDYFVGLVLDITERKHAEEELRRTATYLSQSQKLSHTGTWALILATGELFWSEEHFRIVGLDPTMGAPAYPLAINIIHPDDRVSAVEALERAMLEKREFATECRAVRPDGTIRLIRSRAQPVFNNAGEAVEYVGTIIDITEHLRAEEELRRSEAYLAEAQRLSHTGSGAWNVITGEVFWSDETYRIYGFKPGSVTPSAELFFGIIVHPEDRAWLQDEFTAVVVDKRGYDLLFRILRPDRAVRWIHSIGHSRLNQAGEVLEIIGSVMDITERKEAEERLADSERRFRLLAETLPQQVWSYNADGSANYFNRRWLDYTGITWEDALRAGGHEIVHPDDVPAAEIMWRQVMAERKPFAIELRLRRKDGEYRRFFIQGAPFLSDAGELLEWYGTNTDIEDRKQAEKALQQAQAKLEKVTQVSTMGEMAAVIAHEINQPLGAIANNSSYCLQLLGKPDAKAKKRAALEDIVNDVSRASAIIARIRGLAHGSVPEITKFDVADFVADVVTFAERALTDNRIDMKIAVAKDLPQLHGDRVQLQQVLLNLVVNAIEAMSVAQQDSRILTIHAGRGKLESGAAVTVSVTDNGIGFEADKAEQLFDAFYTTKPLGTGLGLRISRSIVERCGGRLSAKPNSGGGATFSFVLPVAT